MPRPKLDTDVPLTEARRRLPALILRVQDPRRFVILTRHGEPVAGLVSMDELFRIFDAWDMDRMEAGRYRPGWMRRGKDDKLMTRQEAAERVRRVQLDRKMEREVLAEGGMAPVPGGEVAEEAALPPKRRRWWRFRRG